MSDVFGELILAQPATSAMATPDIDAADLETFFSRELNADVVETEVLHEGLNLSLAVSTAETERAFVLRRPNKFRRRSTFNGVAQEYGVLERLRDTAVDAPEPVLLCEDDSVVGDPFLVMTHLDGEAVPLGSDLPERFRNRTARREVATRLVDSLADLHTVETEPFADVCDRRPVREQVDRIVEQFDDATSATDRENAPLRRVADWLRENAPGDSRTALVHGDYRPGNVLFADADRPEIAGVLDWETAFLGDPLVELGYLLLRWRDDGDPTPALDGIRSRHPDADEDVLADLEAMNDRGLAPFTSDPGSPSRRDLVDRYEERTGIAFENERFYRAFAAFVLATVWEDLHRHRIETGGESSRKPYIDYMTEIATSIVDGEFPL
jgi:aminoglycoside phosphotransferase (APT) family kinase protein